MKKQTAAQKVLSDQARKGGRATLKKYGPKHFSDLIKKRWAKKKKDV